MHPDSPGSSRPTGPSQPQRVRAHRVCIRAWRAICHSVAGLTGSRRQQNPCVDDQHESVAPETLCEHLVGVLG